jgi:hypothetical protein
MFKQALGSSESAPNNTKTSSSDSTSQDFFHWVSPWEIPLYFMGKMGSSEWENPWISSDVFRKLIQRWQNSLVYLPRSTLLDWSMD